MMNEDAYIRMTANSLNHGVIEMARVSEDSSSNVEGMFHAIKHRDRGL